VSLPAEFRGRLERAPLLKDGIDVRGLRFDNFVGHEQPRGWSRIWLGIANDGKHRAPRVSCLKLNLNGRRH